MRNLNLSALQRLIERTRGFMLIALGTVFALSLTSCQISPDVENVPGLSAEIVDGSRDDKPAIYESDCYASRESTSLPASDVENCILTNQGSDVSVVVLGDSHSAHWLPPLKALAEQHGWELTYFGKRACSVGEFVVHDGDGGVYEACTGWRESLLRQLDAGDYDVVITSNSARARVVENGEVLKDAENEAARAIGMQSIWATFQSFGSDVIVIADTPYLGMDSPDCLAEHLDNPGECSTTYEGAVLDQPHPDLIAVEQSRGVELVDLTESFCPELQRCDASFEDKVVFRDGHHMTDTFAKSLTDVLEEKLRGTSALADRM